VRAKLLIAEKAVHMSLALVSLGVGMFLNNQFSRRVAAPKSESHVNLPKHAAPKIVGKRLDVADANWGAYRANVVLFLRSDCIYCRMSAPFYRRLAILQRDQNARVSVSVVGLDQIEKLKDFLTSERLEVTAIRRLARPLSGLEATPTLMLVDANGIIRRVEIGFLNSSEQETILRELAEETKTLSGRAEAK